MQITIEYRLLDQTILGKTVLNDIQLKTLFKAHKVQINGQNYRIIDSIYKSVNGEEIIVIVQHIP